MFFLSPVLLATAWYAPVRADVSGGSVGVERRFARAVEIPLARVHSVEVLGGAGGFHRVAGFQGPGISYGRFRTEALGEFQLYDWGGGAYVLLQTDDGAVVLTPDDPDGFVAAVRAGMAGR